jgi:hypothetical protein
MILAVLGKVRTYESLRHLPSAELVEVWSGLGPPALDEMEGEYEGCFVGPSAIRHAEFRKVNGPGEWIAKAFSAIAHEGSPGQGYNLWFTPQRVLRSVRYTCEIGASPIDGRPSLLMHYGTFRHHNSANGLMNEVRKVEEGLYVGIAHMTVETELFGPVDPSTGRSSPEPFVLRGPFGPWQGVDDPDLEVVDPELKASSAGEAREI